MTRIGKGAGWGHCSSPCPQWRQPQPVPNESQQRHDHEPPAGRGSGGGSKAQRGEEDSEMAVIYTLLPILYGFLNSAPATINVVNVEIISIFWRQAVIYSSHFSGAGSHAVKSSDLPIKC